MEKLLSIMRRLRQDCPWDREQTHESLRFYLLEEATEAVEALGTDDTDEIISELGDVLLQIAFHAVIAEETNEYNYEKIENSIVDKLIQRHPHVFGEAKNLTKEQVADQWQEIKTKEKQKSSIPASLPSLARLEKLIRKEKSTINKEQLLKIIEKADDTDQSLADVIEAVVAWGVNHNLHPEIVLKDRLKQRI